MHCWFIFVQFVCNAQSARQIETAAREGGSMKRERLISSIVSRVIADSKRDTLSKNLLAVPVKQLCRYLGASLLVSSSPVQHLPSWT